MYETDLKTLKKHTRVFYSTSTGAGGQNRDRRRTAVRLYHRPSGIRVSIEESTSQAENKKIAFRILQERLEELNRPEVPRIPTKVPRYAKRERLKEKKQVKEKKLRRKPILE